MFRPNKHFSQQAHLQSEKTASRRLDITNLAKISVTYMAYEADLMP